MTEDRELTVEGRAALAAFLVATERGPSTSEIARRIGARRDTAYRLLCRIALWLPIYQDDAQKWRVCEPDE